MCNNEKFDSRRRKKENTVLTSLFPTFSFVSLRARVSRLKLGYTERTVEYSPYSPMYIRCVQCFSGERKRCYVIVSWALKRNAGGPFKRHVSAAAR